MLLVQTTAHALTTITYSVAKDPEVLKRLQQELDEAFPDPLEEMSLRKLEALPYLVTFPIPNGQIVDVLNRMRW